MCVFFIVWNIAFTSACPFTACTHCVDYLFKFYNLPVRFDFTSSNINDENLSKMNTERIPDVVGILVVVFLVENCRY